MRCTPLDSWTAAKVGQAGGRASRTAIEAYQIEKLCETLRLARARSSFYCSHLAAAPEGLTSLADLDRFPFTTAADIREQPLQLVCVSQSEIARVVSLFTSGTTGDPKRLFFTADDQGLTPDFFHVGMSTLVGPGDRVLILLPCETPGGVGDLLATALGRLGAVPIKYGPVHDAVDTLAVMTRDRVDSLVGVPTQVLSLARYRDAGGACVSFTLKSALLTTDYVSPAIIAAVEEAWGCDVYNHYGMTEMGLGGGVECDARRGYHLREADLYFEIVCPETGRPVPEGEEGELVFTTLTRCGMPLIRYRTGDLGRFVPGPCPCGTALRTLAPIRERLSGRIALHDGLTLSMADLDDALFPLPDVVNFRAALSQGGSVDRLQVDVQAVPGASQESLVRIERALRRVPAIQRATSLGHLHLVPRLWPHDPPFPSAVGKRTIATTTRHETAQFPVE